MSQWEHLFIDGEFMSRARLLSGLTVEQVSVRPPGLPHTIYEELWHTTKWQSIVVQCDEPAAAAWIDGGQDFPSEAPGNERMWEDLVSEFLAGSETAVELGRSPDALMEEVGPGERKAFTAELQPGSYLLFCNLPGHFELGMVTRLSVQ